MISRDMEQEKLRHAKSSGTSIAEKNIFEYFQCDPNPNQNRIGRASRYIAYIHLHLPKYT